jgi:hypothetical protein
MSWHLLGAKFVRRQARGFLCKCTLQTHKAESAAHVTDLHVPLQQIDPSVAPPPLQLVGGKAGVDIPAGLFE